MKDTIRSAIVAMCEEYNTLIDSAESLKVERYLSLMQETDTTG